VATFKAEVYKHQKKNDGTYNIKIRVFHNHGKRYIPTQFFVTAQDLTKKLKLKDKYYIGVTDKLISEYRIILNRNSDKLNTMTVDQVVDLITRKQDEEFFILDIVRYGRDYVTELKKKQPGTASNFNTALNKLVEFAGKQEIDVSEINTKFLNDWIEWIASQPAAPGKTKGDRAQSLYVNCLGFIHKKAKKEFNDEDKGIIRIPRSPFSSDLEYIHIGETRKRAIGIDKIKKIANLPYEEVVGQPSRYNLAKDVFIMSFMLIGMNAADLYDCKNYADGRITYNRVKTRTRRKDKAKISIKVEPEVQALVDKYRDPDGIRVFNFYKRYSTVNNFGKAINIGLKQIGENVKVDDLEFYAARHSWATYAINVLGIDKYIVHTALNHVDEEMKVTDMYVEKSWDPIDKANRQVLDGLKLEIGSVIEPIRPEKKKTTVCGHKL